jgi:hypothetical protein
LLDIFPAHHEHKAMSAVDDSEAGLTPAELRDLRRLAGFMVPASAEYGVPGADDEAIFSDIVRSLGRDRNDVRTALATLREVAGGDFAGMDAAKAEAAAMALLVLAGFLYVEMLLNVRPSATGDAVVGEAIGWLFITTGLWIVLSVMLIVGRVMGRMPPRFGWLLIFLQPLALAALLVGGDFYSRRRNLPIIEPAVLPLLIGFYAVWARLPLLQRSLPPIPTTAGIWGAVVILSVVSLVRAANY